MGAAGSLDRVSLAVREAPSVTSPSDGAQGVREFYSVKGIPVHSVMLMPTREAALAYPTRDLTLGHSPSDGFIFNTAFDPTVHEYSENCEETQGFSPTFSAYAKARARQLIDRYDLRGKTILEVGCGKGEFLYLLSTIADNRGIGVDPAYVPGRLAPDADERLTFYQELYNDEHAALKPDFICCRHSLEHIHNVHDFVGKIAASVADRPDVPIWFDLPDFRRILREGAFWDVYYEHCSYFTSGSLARLFRGVGLSLIEMQREYDDQYLVICGVHDSSQDQRFAMEDDLAETAELVAQFPERCESLMTFWRETIGEIHDSGGRCVLWGGGSKGVSFLTTLGLNDEIVGVVDINPHKDARFMPGSGHEVIHPRRLAGLDPTHVIVMNPVYVPEITAQLADLGLTPEVMPVYDERRDG